MPDETDCWVESDRGVRRIQPIELGKGKGLPSEWLAPKSKLPWGVVKASVSLHTWTKICDSLSEWLRGSTDTGSSMKNKGSVAQQQSQIDPDEHNVETTEDRAEAWEYQMPDLSQTASWYKEHVQNLKQVIHGRSDAEELLRDGLEALEIHRTNYTEEGPKYLQLLWWEFPEKHREEVRLGSSMRFLIDPGKELVPHPPMTAEQTEIAVAFLTELMELGVLRKATQPLRRVCPLFVVPKLGQPGQWRCITDMKRAGQNA